MYIETWSLYFPKEQYTVFNESVTMITNFKSLICEIIQQDKIYGIAKQRIFELTYDCFVSVFCKNLHDKNIEIIITCISCAMSELIKENNLGFFKIITRITNYYKNEFNGSIDTEKLGKMIFLRGTVSRVGFKKIIIYKAFFECKKCNEMTCVNISNNLYKQPTKCTTTCKSKSFNFLFNHPQTIIRDIQEIKIQKINNLSMEEKIEEMNVDCVIFDDFVGTLAPGDVVDLCGVVTSESENNSLYKLIVNVNNISHIKNKCLFVEELECAEKDFTEFKKISKTKNIIGSLIHSLYPNIYGHEIIKIGMLLSLFGGTKKYVGHNEVRSEIHTLIIGDPGLGKSRMLLNSCGILPKSTYVSGNLTTTAGLTVSIAHDPVSGDYMADAGALVVSDNGLCCIDEFDKIDDHSALYEAMEDQTVTVAKGGVICSVPTRTTIIAASNPRYGHFNQSKSIKDNLRFDNGLLSRFDLVFILIDNLNEKENYEISEQILKRRHLSSISSYTDCKKIITDLKTDKFLKNYLKSVDTVIYPLSIIKKYISYARASVLPVLSVTAKEELKKFYLSIRDKSGVTTRDLESLIRISEARAKIELKSIASKEDALFSIELYKRILEAESKKSNKKRNIKDYIEMLRSESTIRDGGVFSQEDLKQIYDTTEINKPFEEILEQLNYKGIIIKKGDKKYKLILK